MTFNSETIEKLLSNKFELDCIDIFLTQKTDNEPITYSGSGTIHQDEHGVFQLKLYSKMVDEKKELSHQLKYHKPGKIITADNYFTLKAIDMSGIEWIADNAWVSAHVSFPARGQVIRSSLREIKTTEKRNNSDKDYLFMIVPGNYEIPCNKKEDLPNGGWSLNRSVFTASNIDFEFKKLDDCLILKATSVPGYLKENTCARLIEALSIVTGFVIRPIVVENTQEGNAVLRIRSVSNSFANDQFPIPFKDLMPSDFQSFSCFIERYLETIDAPFSDLFGFWHKTNRAWQAGIQNSSLSLGVAIEGITRSYFRELGSPDDEITQQAKGARTELKKMSLGERIKSRLLNSIGDLLKKSSPKSALHQLIQDGLVSKKMADEWSELRNKSVHPDKLNEDPLAIQRYIDQIYACIALFYRLLFIIIKYEGKYVDYAEEGWPEKNWK